MKEDPRALSFLDFWWRAGFERWFTMDETFDVKCSEHAALYREATAGGLDDWLGTAAGALALVILLDQIPRNIHRGRREAFATDEQARAVAEIALERGFDKAYMMPGRMFFYMPFQHAEDAELQKRSVDLFREAGDKEAFHFALIHSEIIHRFGRFPHRNAILGRTSTEAETRYLEAGGFTG